MQVQVSCLEFTVKFGTGFKSNKNTINVTGITPTIK